MTELLNAEIVQNRAMAIIRSLEQMVDQGLPPIKIKNLESIDSKSHRDLFLVYLGLKPAATHLNEVESHYFHNNRNYLDMMPAFEEIGLTVFHGFDIQAPVVWNPDQEVEILSHNRELVAKVVKGISEWPFLRSLLEDQAVGKIDFAASLGSIVQPYIPWEATYLAGLLLGYPQQAAEKFANYYLEVSRVAELLWDEALQKRTIIDVSQPQTIREVRDNPKAKTAFIRLARMFNYPDQDLVKYVLEIRSAEVPGFQFTTSGRNTTTFERRMSYLYKSSGLDDKLNSFLNNT